MSATKEFHHNQIEHETRFQGKRPKQREDSAKYFIAGIIGLFIVIIYFLIF